MSAAPLEHVVLVDPRDRPVGTAEKMAAHRDGTLHRAFSVVVRNSRGDILLQRRALGKYHSGGLWSNTCCGHPRPGEDVAAAAARRLREEMGIACLLVPRGAFLYRAVLGSASTGGLVEHEYDHVLVGATDADPAPDPAEAMSWEWVGRGALAARVAATPHDFTAWLPMVLERL